MCADACAHLCTIIFLAAADLLDRRSARFFTTLTNRSPKWPVECSSRTSPRIPNPPGRVGQPSRIPRVQRNLRGSDGRALSERFAGLTRHSEALRPQRRITPSDPWAGPSGDEFTKMPSGGLGAHSQAERPPQPRRGRSGGGAAPGRGLRSRPLQSAPFGAVGGRGWARRPTQGSLLGCALPHRPGRGARAWGALGRWGHPLPSAWVGGGGRGAAFSRDPWLSPTGADPQTSAPAGSLGPSLTQTKSNTLSFSTEQNSPSLDFRFWGWERVS